MNTTIKKVAVGAGIALIWVGGLVLVYKASDLLGRKTGEACVAATSKLLSVL